MIHPNKIKQIIHSSLPILLLLGILVIWYSWPKLAIILGINTDQPFIALDSLFGGLAIAILSYTVILQHMELKLQREQLENNKLELRKSVDAQETMTKIQTKHLEHLLRLEQKLSKPKLEIILFKFEDTNHGLICEYKIIPLDNSLPIKFYTNELFKNSYNYKLTIVSHRKFDLIKVNSPLRFQVEFLEKIAREQVISGRLQFIDLDNNKWFLDYDLNPNNKEQILYNCYLDEWRNETIN